MRVVTESRIDGEFNGWDGDNYYRLINGEVWKQARYKYEYRYLYRPRATVYLDGSIYLLEVEGMGEPIQVRRASKSNYIYNGLGNPVGFWSGRYVYRLNGTPIGQLSSDHVHKLSGEYVGELYMDMVVDKQIGNRGNIGNPGNPGNSGIPGNPGNRGVINCGYPDVFQKLLK